MPRYLLSILLCEKPSNCKWTVGQIILSSLRVVQVKFLGTFKIQEVRTHDAIILSRFKLQGQVNSLKGLPEEFISFSVTPSHSVPKH
jgi:hypothetical protein